MLTQKRLKELLRYDQLTGDFICIKQRCGRLNIGGIAGSLNKQGYVRIYIDRKCYFAHRLAFLYMNGEFPSKEIDHKNNIKNDNSWNNLREANRSEKAQNLPKKRLNTKTGILGVTFNKKNNKYHSRIKIYSKSINLGYSDTLEEAYEIYLKAKTKLHPFSMLTVSNTSI